MKLIFCSEIIKMMNSEMNQIAKNKDLDIYPESLRAEIDGLNEWIYNDINKVGHVFSIHTSEIKGCLHAQLGVDSSALKFWHGEE